MASKHKEKRVTARGEAALSPADEAFLAERKAEAAELGEAWNSEEEREKLKALRLDASDEARQT